MLTAPQTYALKGHKQLRVYHPLVPLYNIPFYVYIGPTVSDAAIYAEADHPGVGFSDFINPSTGAYAIQLDHPEEGLAYCILLGVDRFGPEYNMNPHSTIAHEALHLSWFMGNELGLKYNYDNHEAQAYLMQYITESTIHILEDYCKRYKIKNVV